jgi:hypothetical protein
MLKSKQSFSRKESVYLKRSGGEEGQAGRMEKIRK